MKKRVALCFSGQPRALDEGYHFHYKNIIEPNYSSYKIDVFFHTWTCDQVKKFIELYCPISFLTEPSIRMNQPLEFGKRYGYHSLVSEAYSCHQSILLKRAEEAYLGLRYDYVIRSRTDFAVNVPIFLDQLDLTRIYITDIGYNGSVVHPSFIVGNSRDMDQVCSYINNIEPESYRTESRWLSTEDVLFNHLNQTGLIQKVVLFHHPNPFPAGRYNSTPHSIIRDDMHLWSR